MLPRDRLNRAMFCGFLVCWAMSCVALPYPKFFAIQHLPTVVGAVTLVAVERHFGTNRASFSMIMMFLLLHVLGARYLYSYVPYDDWSERLLGVRINEQLGFTRNHYDRVVHFSFGLLFVYPIWEALQSRFKLDGLLAAAAAITFVLAASAVYEIAEWGVAMTFAPDWAESYNGQQGDAWDAQRDMALAWLGALLSAAVVGLVRRGGNRRSL